MCIIESDRMPSKGAKISREDLENILFVKEHYFIPEHDVPFPVNPLLQTHEKDPGVSRHVA